jgi:hypothetical protein
MENCGSSPRLAEFIGMSERIINSAWRIVLIGVIFVLGCAGLFQLYQGLLDLLGGHWDVGIAPLVRGLVMASAVYWLARHRGELVDI